MGRFKVVPAVGKDLKMVDVIGSNDPETLVGSTGADYIWGGGGSDSIFGDAGNDDITSYGYEGGEDVVIDGGDGDDDIRVTGQSEVDFTYEYGGYVGPYGYYGGEWVETIVDLAEATVDGGNGNDTIDVRIYRGTAVIDGGAGLDHIVAEASEGLTLTGGSGADLFSISPDNRRDNAIEITDFETGPDGDVIDTRGIGNFFAQTTYTGGNPFATGHLELSQVGADVQMFLNTDPGGSYGDRFLLVTFRNVDADDFVAANFSGIDPKGGPIIGETIIGTTIGDDFTFGYDNIIGGLGDDTIDGLSGEDFLDGAEGDDIVIGGKGNDWVSGGTGNDTVFGSWGNDDLNGGQGDDTVYGGSGNDTIYGGDGFDSLFGGTGGDEIRVNSYYGDGLEGTDVFVDGGDGEDTIRVAVRSAVDIEEYYVPGFYDPDSYSYYGGYFETITTITDMAHATVFGGAGRDDIFVEAADGVALVDGGAGDDTITASAGQGLTVWGGAGSDLIRIEALDAGKDNLAEITDFATGPGGDVFDMSSVLGLLGATGFSEGNPFGTGHLELLQDGPDVLLRLVRDPGGYDSDSTVLVTFRNTNAAEFDAANFTDGISPDGSPVVGIDIKGSVYDYDGYYYSSGRDFIDGTLGGDTIDGLSGDDLIYGGAGNDTLIGGKGADDVFGGTGDDTVYGTWGNDYLDGGAGNDIVFGGVGNDRIESFAGSDGLYGDGGGDDIYANVFDGADVVVDGGDGEDTINVTASGQVEYEQTYVPYSGDGGYGYGGYYTYERVVTDLAEARVFGGADSDDITVRVTDGTAEIDGGAGSDSITAFATDGLTITGGAGSDRILVDGSIYGNTPAALITDFETGPGGDLIDLGRVLEELSGISSIGGNPFATGHLELVQVGPDVELIAHPNPDGSYGDSTVLMVFQNTNAADFDGSNFSDGINPDGSPVPGRTIIGTAVQDGYYTYDSGEDVIVGGIGGDTIDGLSGNDNISGGAGDDIVIGGKGEDYLEGDSGNDIVYGTWGNDTLDGGAGDDELYGGTGNDVIYGGGGSDVLSGDGGADLIEVYGYGLDAAGADVVVYGGDGEDVIRVQAEGRYEYEGSAPESPYDYYYGTYVLADPAEAQVYGGDASDDITVRVSGGTAVVDGGAGADQITASATHGLTVTGGLGADVIRLEGLSPFSDNPVEITDFQAGAGGDVIDMEMLLPLLEYTDFAGGNPFGSGHFALVQDGVDTKVIMSEAPETDFGLTVVLFTLRGVNAADLDGTNFSDGINPDGSPIIGQSFNGTGFADDLFGGLAGDTIDGLAGEDSIFGGQGNDRLIGGRDDDYVYGDSGDDEVFGTWGHDQLYGGAGDDTVFGGSGHDAIYGGDGSDSLFGDAGADFIYDVYSYSYYGDGADSVIDGGDGDDNIQVTLASRVDHSYDYYSGETETTILDISEASVAGGAGKDTITVRVTDGFAIVDGGADDDVIAASADLGLTVFGGTGSDTISLTGLSGFADSLAEIADFETGPGGDVIDMNPLFNLLSVVGFDGGNPFGTGHFELRQIGADTALILHDNPGDSFGQEFVLVTFRNVPADGFDGSNFNMGVNPDGSPLEGETISGTDEYDYLTGGVGGDTLFGEGADDYLYGGGGPDEIYGGEGYDILNGGAGVDWLFGGTESDQFEFFSIDEAGVGEGNRDVIADFEEGDVIDLSYLGPLTFTETTPDSFSVWYAQVGDDVVVKLDSDGIDGVDAEIEVLGVTSLSELDFWL